MMNVNEKLSIPERIDTKAISGCSDAVIWPQTLGLEKTQSSSKDSDDYCSHASSPNDSTIYRDDDVAAEDAPVRDMEAVRTTSSCGPPYSVFTTKQKRFIIFMAVLAGFFSPLSSNTFFPALNVIASDLHVSNALINLTVTTYMIFQGLAPTVFGDFADIAGRRPAYIVGFIIYIGANLGMALQNSFAGLLVLRCMQSTGSSATIALGSGVVADISTSAERGTYMGWVNSGILLGPAIAPIIGGVLSQFLGWRSIFWFLFVLVLVLLIPFIAFFPETGRNVVGNGSIEPQGWNKSLLNYLAARKASKSSSEPALPAPKRPFKFPNPLHTLAIIREKDISILLLYNSIVYTAFYDIVASTPYLFARSYGFNELQIGLCFLPFGVGAFIAPIVNGRLLDWNFRRVARLTNTTLRPGRMVDLASFPFERARVHCAWPLVVVGLAALLCYGWVMSVAAPPLAAALVLHFIMGLCLTGSFGVMSVMLVDTYPKSPATATAGNNLVRCLMGAGGTAVIIYMIEGMGVGWCFTLISGVVAAATPMLWVLLRWGPIWRKERVERDRKDEENKQAKESERNQRLEKGTETIA